VQTLTFDSDDLDLTEDFLSRAYARMRIGGSPAGSRARVRRSATPSLSVDELALDFDMSYAVTPLGRICLCVVHDGTIEDHVYPGVQESFGPGDVVSFVPPDQAYAGVVRAARYNITMLDPALLDQVATAAPAAHRGPVRLTGHRPHSPAAAAAQHLAATVLATFPNSALTDPTGTDRADAHPAALRRALTYIDDHADEPVTVAEIAAAAHITVRALQYAFRRHLDTTPLAHLRRVRLAHAHHELLAADPRDGTTVTQVAVRWGFAHPGRFAALYRAAYGRSPHRTLVEP
jgi:AraC-like DNA-binding protein